MKTLSVSLASLQFCKHQHGVEKKITEINLISGRSTWGLRHDSETHCERIRTRKRSNGKPLKTVFLSAAAKDGCAQHWRPGFMWLHIANPPWLAAGVFQLLRNYYVGCGGVYKTGSVASVELMFFFSWNPKEVFKCLRVGVGEGGSFGQNTCSALRPHSGVTQDRSRERASHAAGAWRRSLCCCFSPLCDEHPVANWGGVGWYPTLPEAIALLVFRCPGHSPFWNSTTFREGKGCCALLLPP